MATFKRNKIVLLIFLGSFLSPYLMPMWDGSQHRKGENVQGALSVNHKADRKGVKEGVKEGVKGREAGPSRPPMQVEQQLPSVVVDDCEQDADRKDCVKVGSKATLTTSVDTPKGGHRREQQSSFVGNPPHLLPMNLDLRCFVDTLPRKYSHQHSVGSPQTPLSCGSPGIHCGLTSEPIKQCFDDASHLLLNIMQHLSEDNPLRILCDCLFKSGTLQLELQGHFASNSVAFSQLITRLIRLHQAEGNNNCHELNNLLETQGRKVRRSRRNLVETLQDWRYYLQKEFALKAPPNKALYKDIADFKTACAEYKKALDPEAKLRSKCASALADKLEMFFKGKVSLPTIIEFVENLKKPRVAGTQQAKKKKKKEEPKKEEPNIYGQVMDETDPAFCQQLLHFLREAARDETCIVDAEGKFCAEKMHLEVCKLDGFAQAINMPHLFRSFSQKDLQQLIKAMLDIEKYFGQAGCDFIDLVFFCCNKLYIPLIANPGFTIVEPTVLESSPESQTVVQIAEKLGLKELVLCPGRDKQQLLRKVRRTAFYLRRLEAWWRMMDMFSTTGNFAAVVRVLQTECTEVSKLLENQDVPPVEIFGLIPKILKEKQTQLI